MKNDFLNKEISRRDFLKLMVKGAAVLAGGTLLVRMSPILLDKLESLSNNYSELNSEIRNYLISTSVPVPKKKIDVTVEIGGAVERSIKKDNTNENSDYYKDIMVSPLLSVMKNKKFKDEANSIAVCLFSELESEITASFEIMSRQHYGSGFVLISDETIASQAVDPTNFQFLFFTAYHVLPKVSKYLASSRLWFLQYHLGTGYHVTAYSKALDICIVNFYTSKENINVSKSIGLRFTTRVNEGEPVYMRRHANSRNINKGQVSKGTILLQSFYNKAMHSEGIVDLVVTTIEAYEGDSGSPVFNRNGEVCGILLGTINESTTGKFICSLVLRYEYVKQFIDKVSKELEVKLSKKRRFLNFR